MIFKSCLDLFIFFNIDCISKYNIFIKKFLLNIHCLKIIVKFDLKEINFLTNFFNLSKIFFSWFNSKISILKFYKNFQKTGRASIVLFCGFTVNKTNNVYVFLDFFFNVVFFISKVIDNSIKFTSRFFSYSFSFTNINYLLGLNLSKIYNWKKEILVIIKYNKIKKNGAVNFDKNLLNFYEKLFL